MRLLVIIALITVIGSVFAVSPVDQNQDNQTSFSQPTNQTSNVTDANSFSIPVRNIVINNKFLSNFFDLFRGDEGDDGPSSFLTSLRGIFSRFKLFK